MNIKHFGGVGSLLVLRLPLDIVYLEMVARYGHQSVGNGRYRVDCTLALYILGFLIIHMWILLIFE